MWSVSIVVLTAPIGGLIFLLALPLALRSGMGLKATIGAFYTGLMKRVSITDTLLGAAVLVTLAIVFPLMHRLMFERKASSISLEQVARSRRLRRGSRKMWIALWVFLSLLVVATIASSSWESACLMSSKICIQAGLMTVAFGVTGRIGSRVVCARCNYAMGTWRGSSDRCPECGQDWKRPWNAALGVRRVHWPTVLIGVGFLSTAAACIAAMRMFGS